MREVPGMAEDDHGAFLVSPSLDDAAALEPASKNPYLVYVGGLDEASVATMRSAAKLVVRVLTQDQLDRPEDFPWHEIDYGIARRLRQLLRKRGLAPATINKALVCVRSVAKEAWLLGRLCHEEYQRIVQVKNVAGKRLPAGRMVALWEIATLLDGCKMDGNPAGLRDGARRA